MALSTLFASSRRQRIARERLIEEFQQTLMLVVDEASLYAAVLRAFEDLFGSRSLALLLLDSDTGRLEVVAVRGFPRERLAAHPLRASDRLVNWLSVNETSLPVETGSGVFRYLDEAARELLAGLGVAVCVPLRSMNRITGLALVGPRESGTFAKSDLELMDAVGAQTALAVENARLNRQQRDRLRRMYRAERLATAGQLAAGVAHEIRNPLTAIRSTIQFLLRGFEGDAGRRDLLEGVVEEVDRINQIITGLLSFARPPEFRIAPVAIDSILEFSLGLLAAQTRMHNVRVVRRFEPLPPVAADEAQLKQLFLNLLLNAVEAMPEGGELRVETAVIEPASPALRMVRVSIADTGRGMTEQEIERIFDPFFTTKPEGTGLGLSVSYAIMERHRGEISVESEPGRGATFTLRFPVQ